MLEVASLTTDYGPVRAVNDVSLRVPEGTVTAVLGANGAGKTTLLRTISGLVRPRGGSVKLDGREISTVPVEEIVRLGLAHVPEGRGVIGELSVVENLRLGGLWRGREAPPLDDVYDLFPRLRERRNQPASNLSGGERQMLSIGRALAARPQVLLLDEPSLGLAPALVAQIMALIRRLAVGRTERPQRTLDRQPRDRAEPRPSRRRSGPRLPSRRRAPAPRVPGVLRP
jgi:branched-chain amino acid transport system ATP-binding protein